MSRPIPLSHLQFDSPGSADAELEVENVFPRSHTLDPPDIDILSIHPPWKRSLHELLEQPTSSQSAFLIHLFTTGLILFSAGVTVLETVPFFRSTSASVWFGIETSLVALFTVEYIARSVAWSSSWSIFFSWFSSFFGIIDLLAILPYYIEIALQVDTSAVFRFSILRTFRLLRVFRSFRYNNTILLTIEVMYLSFKRSKHALLALGFFVVMFLVVFSTLLYFSERGTWDPILQTFMDVDGDPSQFASIPAAAWFVLVTITTVGYGEITPRSVLGRLITVPLLVFGLLLIALPSFVLGREFSIVWEEMEGTSGKPVSQKDMDNAGAHRLTNAPPLLLTPATSTQRDLAQQLADLQGALDAQGQMLRQLMSVVERQGEGFRSRTPASDDSERLGSRVWADGDRARSKGKERVGTGIVAL